MSDAAREALRAAALLAAVAVLAAGLIATTEYLGRERIADADRRAELAALGAVLPAASHDNAPLDDVVTVRAPGWLGTDVPMRVWRARRDGAPTQLVLELVAPTGYGGPIALLLGVDVHARIVGVRVTAHQETPGLGDLIEPRRSDWIERFRGRSLRDPPPHAWRIRRDGGDFDQFTGASITPRAVVAALADALAFVEAHGPALYAAGAGTQLHFDDGPPPTSLP